jgi:predicted HTH domain antitoxin
MIDFAAFDRRTVGTSYNTHARVQGKLMFWRIADMSLILNLPSTAEHAFRDAWGDQIDRKGLEALTLEGYREGKLSLGKIAELLGLATNHEADRWLAERGVALNYSADDFRKDCQTIDRLRASQE